MNIVPVDARQGWRLLSGGDLDDGRVVGEAADEAGDLFGHLADHEVLDVHRLEDDVLVDVVPGRDGVLRGAVLRPEGFHFSQSYG
jgi:hypothetical protein